jgi:3-oxoacyl-[acyl-carrier protein] reductase
VNEKPVMIITGTRKGIGRHLAETYARRGYVVEGCSRGEAGWEAENYTHHQLDVADERQVKLMVTSVAKNTGASTCCSTTPPSPR